MTAPWPTHRVKARHARSLARWRKRRARRAPVFVPIASRPDAGFVRHKRPAPVDPFAYLDEATS